MRIEHRIIGKWWLEWRGLRTWGRALSECTATIEEYKGQQNFVGLAYDTTRRAILRVDSSDLPSTLATVLHELAHLAAGTPRGVGCVYHGPRWRALFQQAVEEVTGEYVYVGHSRDEGRTKGDVHAALEAAVRRWWQRSGNELMAKMLISSERGGRRESA